MKVNMQRKAASVRDWYEAEARRETCFEAIEPCDAVIEKRVTLSETEFKNFCEDFFADRAWIAKSRQQTFCDEKGVCHCLAVTSQNSDITVLVAAEGYSYARYTAVIPNRK